MVMTSPPPTTHPRSKDRRRPDAAATAAVVVLVLLLAAAGLLAVWRVHVEGSRYGPPVDQTRAVPAFSGVELAGANDVVVRVGGPQRVVVRSDADLVDLVTTQVRAGTLVIGQRHPVAADTWMSVDVTVPSLDAATISGSGQLTVVGVQGQDFTAAITGSGQLSVTGTADRYSALLSGVGSMQLGGLVGIQVTATLSGSGQMTVNASGSIDVELSGTGSVVYRGSPADVTKVVTGTGAVTAM